MLEPMRMLEILDEDTETLQRVLGEIDVFIQHAASPVYEAALRQREHISLELAERNASWAVVAPIRQPEQAAHMAPALCGATTAPSTSAQILPPAPMTPPAEPQAPAPEQPSASSSLPPPPLLPLAQRIRAAQRKEQEAKASERRERAERGGAA